jgi:hypothetical protein
MNVGHATVTQLQGISVKYFMERIVFREAIINCLEEFVSDIRFDIRVVRWIKPYNVSKIPCFLNRTSKRHFVLDEYQYHTYLQ